LLVVDLNWIAVSILAVSRLSPRRRPVDVRF
jgi:hypothetical protein